MFRSLDIGRNLTSSKNTEKLRMALEGGGALGDNSDVREVRRGQILQGS